MDATTLFENTRARLRKYEGQYAQIARDGKISYSTLTKLAQGHLDNPTVESLQAVIVALDAFEGTQTAAGEG